MYKHENTTTYTLERSTLKLSTVSLYIEKNSSFNAFLTKTQKKEQQVH